MNTSVCDTALQCGARLPLWFLLLAVLAYTAVARNFDQPFVSYTFAAAIVFLIAARPGGRYSAVALLAMLGFSLLHSFFRFETGMVNDPISLYLGMLGRGALFALGCAALRGNREDHRRLYQAWLLPVAILTFVLTSLLVLKLTVWASPAVLDPYLYIFDGSLGVQPSFFFGRLFAHHNTFVIFEREIYCSLSIPVALLCAAYWKRKHPWQPLLILGTAGVLGYIFYFLFPATGPLYIAGPTFPNFPHPFSTLAQIQPLPLNLATPAPRNAMPSLHVAWALLLWFNSRPFSRFFRGVLLIYILLTVTATLGSGEHYLADLAVSVPFSVGVQAAWTRVSTPTRYFVLVVAAALTFAWLGLLRYATQLFLVSPAVPWAWIVVSTTLSLFLYLHLRKRETTYAA